MKRINRLTLMVAALLASVPLASAQDVVRYVHLDALGSVRAVSNEANVVIERHDYLPFGEECTTGPCASNPGVGAGQPRKFTGKERDQETGLDYFGARYYGAGIARFTCVDPVYTWRDNLVDPQRWNRYTYVANRPLKYVDPTGAVIDLAQLSEEERGSVLSGLNSFTGNTYGTTSDGALRLDSAGPERSRIATAYLDELIASETVYHVLSRTGDPDISLAKADHGQMAALIDFGDFSRLDFGWDISPRTLNVGAALVHELVHLEKGWSDVASIHAAMTTPGPIESFVNEMRRQRGLPERTTYGLHDLSDGSKGIKFSGDAYVRFRP